MTFHGFCEWVLQHKSDIFGDEFFGFRLADDLEKMQCLRQCIDQGNWKHLRPFGAPYLYEYEIRAHISDLKREAFTPKSFKALLPDQEAQDLENPKNFYQKKTAYGEVGDMKKGVQEKIKTQYEKCEEMADIWTRFEEAKHALKIYDFDDQIAWVLNKLQTSSLLKSELQEQFQFILVDEYQDTNQAQNEILWNLTDFFEDPNLFVVGDGDQAIYRFQGASIANMKSFLERFPTTTQITLSQNYRSAPFVLASAYALVAHNQDRLDPDISLSAEGKHKDMKGVLKQGIFCARSSEIVFIADQINTLIEAKTKPSEIAILVRENKEVREIADYLSKFKIPVSTQISDNIFQCPEVLWFLDILALRQDFQKPDLLYRIMQAPFSDIPASLLLEIQVTSRTEKKSLFEVITEYKERHTTLDKFWNLLTENQKNYFHLPPSLWAEKVFHHSGMAQFYTQNASREGLLVLQKIKKFFEWIKLQEDKGSTFSEILERVELHKSLGVPLFPDPLPQDNQSVKIMTAHKSKGLEFEVVFLPGMNDKTWGNKRKIQKIKLPSLVQKKNTEDENQEERRLCFVALTRAKSQIYMTQASQDFSGREKAPALFWHEVPPSQIQAMSTGSIESRAHQLLPTYFQAPQAPLLTLEESEILKSLAQNFVWSATSLQNYLDCPRKFLYLNLIKIPTPSLKIMGYGSAIHKALEQFITEYKKTKKQNPDQALKYFKLSLQKQNLNTLEFNQALEHGNSMLQNYLKSQLPDLDITKNWELEAGFRTNIEGIDIYGKIDKIELSEDGKTGTLVDYKSGKPKNIVHGDRFWRQLVFYDLLVKNTKGLKWQAQNLVLEFLTPDAQGNFVKKDLQITQEDRDQVLQELKSAHKAVLNLEFPNKENPEKDTEIDYWQNFGTP